MKALFQIKNVMDMVPAMPLSCTFSQMGGTIGSAEDATWRVQDVSGTVSDIAARIVVIDGHFTVEPLPGMALHINGGSAPMTPNRPVILTDKDVLSIGELHCMISMGSGTGEETHVHSIASFAANSGRGDEALLIDGEYTQASEVSLNENRNSGQDPLILMDRDVDRQVDLDPLEALASSRERLAGEQETNLRRDLAEELTGDQAGTAPDYATMANASHMVRTVSRDRYGFEEEAEPGYWDRETKQSAEIDLGHPVDHVALLPLTKALGLPLGNMKTEEANQILSEIGGALRASVEGLVKLHAAQLTNGRRVPFSSLHMHALEDNPLRFSKGTDEALHTMFAKRGAVHQSAPSAMTEMMDHLDMHQSATEDAIDQSLDAVLASLLPQALEKRFQSYSPEECPDKGVERDAWCWRMYKAYFSELRSNHQRGLQMLFWEVFQHEYQGIVRKNRSFASATEGNA